jgi:hypothetical protein
VKISGSPKLVELLLIIRNISEDIEGPHNLVEKVVRRAAIKNEIDRIGREKNKRYRSLKSPTLSQRLRRLRDTGTIEKIKGSRSFKLTAEGVMISGLLGGA